MGNTINDCYDERDGYLCVSAPKHSHLHPLYVSAALMANYFVCGLWRDILEQHFGKCVSPSLLHRQHFSVWWLNTHTDKCLYVCVCLFVVLLNFETRLMKVVINAVVNLRGTWEGPASTMSVHSSG